MMDVKEKLVELLKEISYDQKLGWYDLWDMREGAEDIADLLIANGVTVQGWKSAYDPPKRMRAVIVLYKDNTGMQVGGGYVNDFGVWTLMGNVRGIIEYWMPLLPPPKGE